MATPNYQFEKRRRELEKKAKKEEKRKLKAAEAAAGPAATEPDAGATPAEPTQPV